MAELSSGESRPPVRVRYYPRRVARPPVTEPLSPGQALHLVDDPERAELARHTAQQQEFVVAEPAVIAEPVAVAPTPAPAPAPAAAVPAAVAAVPVPGRWRRLWRRLTGSD